MPDEESRPPRFDAVHSAGVDPATGDLVVRLIARDGTSYRLAFSAQIGGTLLGALAYAIGQHQREQGRPLAYAQPLTVHGIRPFVFHDGTPGVSLILDGGAELPIAASAEALQALRTGLAGSSGRNGGTKT